MKYYLYIASGLLSLVFTFFIKVSTAINYAFEYGVIFNTNLEQFRLADLMIKIYLILYYILRALIVIGLLIPPNSFFTKCVFVVFIMSIISGYFMYKVNYQPVWETYVPYLLSMIAWLYLGLTVKSEQSQ